MLVYFISVIFVCSNFFFVESVERCYDERSYVHYQDTIEAELNLYYVQDQESILIYNYMRDNYDVIYLYLSDSLIRATQRASNKMELIIGHEYMFSCDSIKMRKDENGECIAINLKSPFNRTESNVFLFPLDTISEAELLTRYIWLAEMNSETVYELCETIISDS